MRLIQILIILLLCLNFSLFAQPSLDTKVTLKMKATQSEILKTITEKYGIRFSYSNNMVSLDKNVSLNVQGKSLKEVLDLLFTDHNVNYSVVGNQVVLKKKTVKKSEGATSDLRKGATSFVIVENSNSITINSVSTIKDEEISEDDSEEEVQQDVTDKLEESLMVSSDTTVKAPVLKAKKPKGDDVVSLRKQYLLEKRRLRDEYLTKMDSLTSSGNQETKENFKSSFKTISQKLREELNEIADSIETHAPVGLWKRLQKSDSTSDSLSGKESQDTDSVSADYKTMPLAITFVPPMSTNGMQAPEVVNKTSLNILAGTARGLDGFEVGTLVNVEKEFVNGVQIAGLSNIVGKNVKGVQVAGLTNSSSGYAEGVQVSGLTNVVKDSMYCFQFAGLVNSSGGNSLGGQFSGLVNFSNGYMYGPQCAGFANVANGMMTGPQLGGFINVANGSQKGIQGAGFMNIAKHNSEGCQLAGFMNTTGNLRGAQASGFINIAKKVKGVQIGIINIADTVDGAQIGILNIAKKGYRRFEIWGSETLYGNIAFKMGGSRSFYNIFALGGQAYDGGKFRTGYGIGFGSEIKASEKVCVNIDAISYHINEDGLWTNKLNILNQLRVNVGVALGERTTVFFGPTFNVMVSQIFDGDKNEYGSNIAPWTVFNETYDGRVDKGRKENTNVKMWPGFNAGIRF
ncbi:MAG: STN domain-containing protein [Sporocytophaga sp.]|nr:STN domain-containing protein [Sporocytophaga sp.]